MADNPGESSDDAGSSSGRSDSVRETTDSMADMHSRIEGLFSELSTKQKGIEKLHGFLEEERQKREMGLQGRSNQDQTNRQNESPDGAHAEIQQQRDKIHKLFEELKRINKEKERLDKVTNGQRAYINDLLNKHFNEDPLDEEHSMADILRNKGLEEKLKDQEDKIFKLQTTVDKLSNDSKNKDDLIDSLKRDMAVEEETRRKELDKKEEAIERHLKEIGAREEQLTSLRAQMEKEQEKFNTIEAEQTSQKVEAERLKEELQTTKHDSKGLSDQVKILQEDREFLRNRIISMAAAIAENIANSEETLKSMRKIMEEGVEGLRRNINDAATEKFEKFLYYGNKDIIKYNTICFIADEIVRDWKMLAGFLGLKPAEIESIDEDFKNIGDKALKMLSVWFHKNPKEAVLKCMEDALRKLERNDIADKITTAIIESTPSGTNIATYT